VYLNNTDESFRVVLGSAVTTSQMDVSVNFIYHTTYPAINGMVYKTAGTTPVDVVVAPAGGESKQIRYITVFNNDTAINVVKLIFRKNNIDYVVCATTVNPGETLLWNDNTGFRIFPERNTGGSGGSGGVAMTVAANDAPTSIRDRADFVCDGVADDVQIASALAISDNVILSEGQFNMSAAISLDRAGMMLEGSGTGSTVMNGSLTGPILKIGSFGAVINVANTQIINITVRGLRCTNSNFATGNCGIEISGVKKLLMERVFASGYDGWKIRNCAQANFDGCDSNTANNANWHLYQGVYDYVEGCSWDGGAADNAGTNTIGILFDTFLNGGAEAIANIPEYKHLTFSAMRVGNDDITAGTISIKFLAGVRSVVFSGCAIRYSKTLVDATVFSGANYSAMRFNPTFIGCSFYGTAANPSTYLFRYAGPSTSVAHIIFENVFIDRAVTFIQVDAGNPSFTLLGVESPAVGNITNLYVVSAGSPTLRALVPITTGTTKVPISKNDGTITIAAASTSVSVSHGLWTTPNARSIKITPTSTLGSALRFWISGITATTFSINVDVAPGGAGASFAWSAEIL